MNPIFNKIHYNLVNIVEKGMQNRSKFLRNIGTIGWGLSCVGQLFSISINSEIPTKEKKFLIPQEITDGVTNMTLFWFLTSKATEIGELLVAKGKILPHSLKDLQGLKVKSKDLKEATAEMIEHIEHKLSHLSKKEVATTIKEFEGTVKGSGLIACIAGSALAVSVAAPLVRNKIASWYQGWHMHNEHKENIKKVEKPQSYNTFKIPKARTIYPGCDTSKYDKLFEKVTTPTQPTYNLYKNNSNNMRI